MEIIELIGEMMHFKINLEPPTVTSQEKGIGKKWDNEKKKFVSYMYTKEEVKRAKQLFTYYLRKNRPDKPMEGAVFLKTIWTYKPIGNHKDGEYKTTKPDTDNIIKTFKDCMTKEGFWKDDAQVCYEVTVKKWGNDHGIEVSCSEIGGNDAEEIR